MSFEVYATKPYTHKIGKVHANGEVVDILGNQLGKVYNDGQILAKSGNKLGTAFHDGKFVGELARFDYKLDLKGNILLGNENVGALRQIENGLPKELALWAACTLLLHFTQVGDSAAETIVASPTKLSKMIKDAKIEAFRRDQELQTLKKKSPFR